MTEKVYTDYFYNESAYNTHDGGYIPLEVPDIPQQPLRIPELLKPDQETDTDMYYTLTAQEGETQLLPGAKTKTWGFSAPLLGKAIVMKNGKTIHMHLQNHLPEMTTFHWHGLNIPGPIEDGGCHAPVYPDGHRDIQFKIHQPAATVWLHAHPCPETAYQVWRGLAALSSSRMMSKPNCPSHATMVWMTFHSFCKTVTSMKIISGIIVRIMILMASKDQHP